MSDAETAALVGATGGAGTTRLCVELAATLARAGDDVAVFDAALATQGLEQYLPGHVERDLTGLLRERDPDPSDCGVDFPVEAPGTVTAWPAYAKLSADTVRELGEDAVVVDGRRALDEAAFQRSGLTYRAIGLGRAEDV